MASLLPSTAKNGCWVILLGFLSVTVVIVMVILVSLLFKLSMPTGGFNATVTHRPVLNLPTASFPTATPGPPLPLEIAFVHEEPIKGFSNCDKYGFYGVVKAGRGNYIEKVQVVIWEESGNFLALDTTDTTGSYNIEFANEPTLRKLWVQVYQDDVPVSMPLPLEIQIDCRNGFQIYQIDWQALAGEGLE